MIKMDDVVIGNTVSVVYFNTAHRASILNGRIHDIVDSSEYPYIVVMAPDTSTTIILRTEIRTLQKK